MAIVRKRTRSSADGTQKVTWLVDYRDAQGDRRFETFKLKKLADARLTDIEAGLKLGTHTPNSTSQTLREAAELWYQRCVTLKRERATLANYRRFLDAHIIPLLGRHKLSHLTTPGIEAFCDELLKRVPPLTARKLLTALKGVLSEAKRRGLVAQNVAADSRIEIPDRDASEPLEAGCNMPSKDEVRRLIEATGAHAEPRWRPFIVTLAFTGLRSFYVPRPRSRPSQADQGRAGDFRLPGLRVTWVTDAGYRCLFCRRAGSQSRHGAGSPG